MLHEGTALLFEQAATPVCCREIAAIWVAFFSRCQRDRCRQELVRTASDATKEALREAMSGLEEAKRAAERGGFSFSDVVSADHDIDLS